MTIIKLGKKAVRMVLGGVKYVKYRRKIKHFGRYSVIRSPLRLEKCERIYIADNVAINKYCWLAANPLTGEDDCQLTIGSNTTIGDFCHIYATKRINIMEGVLLANHVYISDNLHSYEQINVPIKHQPIKQLRPVTIGEGSWLGENVCVIGASVGKHCVIGSNSVVTHDIPDYSVAVGAPAKVIKRYDFETEEWIKTK